MGLWVGGEDGIHVVEEVSFDGPSVGELGLGEFGEFADVEGYSLDVELSDTGGELGGDAGVGHGGSPGGIMVGVEVVGRVEV